MIKYMKIPTTYEVYAAIRKVHAIDAKNIGIMESYTNIVAHGTSTIYTVWGFKDSDSPLVGAETTYWTEWGEKDKESEKHIYWMYAVKETEDED